MKIRKNLTKLALGTLVSIGVSCADDQDYHFNGKIGEEQVRFYERDFDMGNILEVTKKDGTKIKYVDDWDDDLKLDKVKIKKDGKTKKYSKYSFTGEFLKEAQKKWSWYLDTIHAINYQEALDDLSK